VDNDLPTIQARLGGKWLFSWQTLVLSIPLLALNVGSNIANSNSDLADFLPIIPITLGITLLLGIAGYLCDRFLFAEREVSPVPIGIVTVGFLIVGSVMGATTSWALTLFDAEVSRGMLFNALLGGIFLVWWGTMVTLLLDGRDRFSRTRSRLIEDAVQIELALLQEAEVSELMRASIRTEINQELTQARTEFARKLEGEAFAIQSNEWTEIASAIRQTASDVIRPMSRRLKDRAEESYPKPNLKTFLWNIVHFQPFRPGAFTLVYLIRTGPIEVEHFGIRTGLISYIVATITIFGTMIYANSLMKRFPKIHSWIFVDTIFVIQFLYLVLHLTREVITGIQIPQQELISNLIASVFLILVTSGFGTFRNIHQDMTSSFKSRLSQSQIEVMAQGIQLSRLATEAAELLHGQVQTKLISCAAAIDQARTSGNVEQFNRALLQARAILELPIPDRQVQLDATIEREIARKCNLWEGLCEIHCDISEPLREVSGEVAHKVGSIIEEAITNSIRHGGATKIRITLVENVPGTISIAVADNGSGPQEGELGLGSDIISRYSSQTNSLKKNPDGAGSILTLDVGRS